MTRSDFIAAIKADFNIGYQGYRMTDGTATLIIDAVQTADRDRIIGHAQTLGLHAEPVAGSEWFGNRPNVRLVVTGFGGGK
jgi:hypothetical protein